MFLAVAVAQTASILVLDEPTAHLDIRHQVEVMELLVGLNERDGTTVVAVLHDLALAAHFFPRVIVMDGGRIVADGGARLVAQRAIDPRRVRRGPGARPPAGGRRMSIRDRPGIARPRTATSGVGTVRAALSMLTRIPVARRRRRRHRRRRVRARRRAGRRHRGDPRRAPGRSGPDPGRDPRGRHARDRERRAPPGRPGRHRRRAHGARSHAGRGGAQGSRPSGPGAWSPWSSCSPPRSPALVSVMTIGRDRRRASSPASRPGPPRGRSPSSSPGPVGGEAPRPGSAPGSSPASGRSMWPPRC